MKRLLPYLLSMLLLASCSAFDYHPYDVNISGATGINARNIALIEAACKDKDTLRVAFMGDTQGWMDDTRDMISDINKRGNVDFVVHGGDMTDFGLTKEFQWQRDIMQKLEVPYVVIIGNHDCLGTGVSSYEKIFGTLNFSFIAARVKFVCLNTNSMEFDYSEPVPDFTFLETEEKSDSALFSRTVLCMHAGPYSDEFNNNVVNPFENEVLRFPGLLFCSMAHDHHFAEQELYKDGVKYYTSDCAKERRYTLFTITPSGYSYALITY